MTKATMKRLKGFDYTKPYFYMVTLKRVKGHRATQPGSPEWNALVEECARLGPGGAGVSTFMSPLEKACGNAIAAAGGKWVVLSPEGFHDRWHPGRQYERFCAEGRMLFLSLYPVLDRLPTKSELYHCCHEMGDVVAALGMADGTALGMADGTAIDNTLMASTAFNHKSAVLPAPSGSNDGNDPAPSGSNGNGSDGNRPASSGRKG